MNRQIVDSLDLYLVQIVKRIAHQETNEDSWPISGYICWQDADPSDEWSEADWAATDSIQEAKIFITHESAMKCAAAVCIMSGGGVICDAVRFMRV